MKYEILGNLKSKKTVVFLHGWGGDSKSLQIFSNGFATSFKQIFISLHSIENGEVLTLNNYAEGVLQILKNLSIKKAFFVAHSFGGRVIAKIFENNKNIIFKAILINAAGIKPKFNLINWLKIKNYKFRKKFKLPTKFKGSEDYAKLTSTMKKTFVNIINENLEKIYKLFSFETIIIAGKKDKSVKLYMAKKMNKLIKNSKLVVFKKSGHFTYLDNYCDVNLLAEMFL